MRISKPLQAFWSGLLTQIGIQMAYQDYIGLERYMETLPDRWVNLHWSVGAALFVVGLVWFCRITYAYEMARLSRRFDG